MIASQGIPIHSIMYPNGKSQVQPVLRRSSEPVLITVKRGIADGRGKGGRSIDPSAAHAPTQEGSIGVGNICI